MLKMSLVYVAGPFRGASAWDIECNIRRAEVVALDVWRKGCACLCPHTNTRFFQGAAPDKVWLDGTLEMLSRCDAIIMIEKWENSSGSRAELLFAKDNNISVLYSLKDLDLWLEARRTP